MLEMLIAIRDVLFALLMSWAGLAEEDSSSQKPGEDARPQQTLSAPFSLK